MKRATLALLSLVAAQRAIPADPTFWFDRAAADIAAASAQPPANAMLTPLDLADMLVEDRGSDPDRQLLRTTLDHYRPTPGLTPAADHARYALNAAYARAILGDHREASSLATDAAASLPAGIPPFARLSIEIPVAMVYARLGDDARAFAQTSHAAAALPFLGKVFTYEELSLAYEDLGKKAPADRARRLAEDAARQSADHTKLLAVIRLYARADDFPAAANLIDAFPNDFHRSDAFVEIAIAQRLAGLNADAAGTLRHAADVLARSDSSDQPSFYWTIARAAAEWRDKDLFLHLAPLVERALEASRADRFRLLPQLAQGYAAIGDPDSYHRLAALASAEPLTGDDAPRQAAIRDVLLAAAAARSGDVAGSLSALDRIIQSPAPKDFNWSDYDYAVPEALVEIDRFDDAIAAVRKVDADPNDLSLLRQTIAKRLIDLHRYDDAWNAAAPIHWPHVRIGLFRVIAAAELAAGHPDAALRHVDSVQIPWERAMTNLGVAERLTHASSAGARRLFDPYRPK